MALDDLIKRRFAKRAAQKYSSGRFTASQTGAKGGTDAQKGYGGYIARTVKTGIKGDIGAGPTPSQSDIEDMITPKRKK